MKRNSDYFDNVKYHCIPWKGYKKQTSCCQKIRQINKKKHSAKCLQKKEKYKVTKVFTEIIAFLIKIRLKVSQKF